MIEVCLTKREIQDLELLLQQSLMFHDIMFKSRSDKTQRLRIATKLQQALCQTLSPISIWLTLNQIKILDTILDQSMMYAKEHAQQYHLRTRSYKKLRLARRRMEESR